MTDYAKEIRMRCTVVAIVEYNADPADYDTDDPEAIARIDQETAEEDPFLFLDTDQTGWTITVEPVAKEPS